MRSLVLIDFDNVHSWLFNTIDRLIITKGPKQASDEATVVFGLNCVSAISNAGKLQTWSDFEQLAKKIVSLLEDAARLKSMEITLSLTAPETVDTALENMLSHAPDSKGTGKFQRIWLLSADQGLRTSIARQTSVTKQYWPKAKQKDSQSSPLGAKSAKGSVWVFDVRKFMRKAEKSSTLEATARQPRFSPSLVIDSDELARWATQQQVQVNGKIDQIAKRVDREPSLLTQIGLTHTKTATISVGVARMAGVMRGESVPISDCRKVDGLEFSRIDRFSKAELKRLKITSVESSPLGLGAVRLHGSISGTDGMTLTARTNLPICVISAGLGGMQQLPVFNGAKIDDSVLLAYCFKKNKNIKGEHQFASFIREKKSTRCELDVGTDQAWWCLTDPLRANTIGKAGSKKQLPPRCKKWIPEKGIEDVVCVAKIIRSQRSIQLVLASPIQEATMVRISADINYHSIGEGWISAQGRCAVLAADMPLNQSQDVPCCTIQSIDPVSLAKRLNLDLESTCILRTMPLLVPTRIGTFNQGKENV